MKNNQQLRRVWAVISFGALALAFIFSIHFNEVLIFLVSLVLLIAADYYVYGKRFYKLAHNPREDLDEREFANQTKAYRYSYMILATGLLLTIVVATIFNDFTRGALADKLPVLENILFIAVFYVTLKLPLVIIGWYEKD